ncbi:MAG: SDR family oxidoreductase [Spirochaetaceae bacterium]|nr:MAG: SDR family oxidoreductase [Spirochaetaceae bacterium]
MPPTVPNAKNPLPYRSALVVGGSGGIGAAVSRRLVAAGLTVRVHGRHPERTVRYAEELSRMGSGLAEAQVLDVGSRSGDAERAADALVGQESPAPAIPDVIVIAMGPFLEKPFDQTTEDEWRALWETNLMLPVAIGRRVLGPMLERGFGRLVVFGGTGTDRVAGYRDVAAYSAAKTALVSWVKSAAQSVDRSAYRARGQNPPDVAVCAVCPGFVDTEYLTDAQRDRYRRIAGGRLQTPEEVTAQVAELICAPAGRSNGRVVAWRRSVHNLGNTRSAI